MLRFTQRHCIFGKSFAFIDAEYVVGAKKFLDVILKFLLFGQIN